MTYDTSKFFNMGDRVIHDNGKYGTVVHSCGYDICTTYVPIKFDDGSYAEVHKCYLTKVQ